MGYMANLVVEGREALIVGGGKIAARKVEDLLAAGARVTVVAPDICDEIGALPVRQHRRPYQPSDIGDSFVVIAATDDEERNAQVSRDCVARHVLVNVVDRPALCTFTVPASVHRGDLTIAIATNGRCPAFASLLREELEDRYGPDYGPLLERFEQERKRMIAGREPGPRIRERIAELYRRHRSAAELQHPGGFAE
ncbi:MAG TPA: bifunctional precorrin-2 dehydrogenase/sirohydrochlorin ferrochelatase [Bryobacteraceae bacterium]|nr:bifunctional precorrin-2 dehydrogenase/sirohydrochlorin ferrochelatase [Bryobacteraceae bacterium]